MNPPMRIAIRERYDQARSNVGNAMSVMYQSTGSGDSSRHIGVVGTGAILGMNDFQIGLTTAIESIVRNIGPPSAVGGQTFVSTVRVCGRSLATDGEAVGCALFDCLMKPADRPIFQDSNLPGMTSVSEVLTSILTTNREVAITTQLGNYRSLVQETGRSHHEIELTMAAGVEVFRRIGVHRM